MNKSLKFKIITKTVVLLFITVFVMGQNESLKSIETNFLKLDFNSRKESIQKINLAQLSTDDKALYYYLYGQIYYENSDSPTGLSYFMKARDIYKAQKKYAKVVELNLIIVEIKRLAEYKYKDYKYLIDEAVAYAIKTNNSALLSKTYKEIGNNLFYYDGLQSLAYYQKALLENKKVKDSSFEADVNHNIGLVYMEKLHDYKLARKYTLLSLNYFQKHNLNTDIVWNYINQADIFIKEKKNDSALIMYQKADAIEIKDNKAGTKVLLYGFMADLYKEMKNYQKVVEYGDKKNVYEKIINSKDQLIAIRDIDAKYQTKENKTQIAGLENDMKKGGAVVIFLFVMLILIVLGYKNLNKKKKIMEQLKQIEIHKLENNLKEQELHEIDRILEVQDKERVKIANDLHDNLGSLLATVKLNFSNLKQRNNALEDKDGLFDKTNSLIEEAYQKVRTFAHTKNAGVIANKGLLSAVQNIAKKVSLPGKLKVEVIPFGLEERIENTLEISIFRMIQEIVTNVIKHASATEIIIHLTQHDDSLNIIVEDNGKGFNPKTIAKKEGMGLANIEKKVEQMGGIFSIDSVKDKGTSIIIDIPI